MQTVRLWVVVLVSAVARIGLAWTLGLGVDESYEVVLSRVPSLGYFDHPPLSFWLAGLPGNENRVILRLPFIALFALTTVLLFRLTARLYGERAALVAAVLLNVSPVFSLSTGGWILPDGPLDCAIVTTALCLTSVLAAPGRQANGAAASHKYLYGGDSHDGGVHGLAPGEPWRWWMGAGAATGIALLSKYHGAFLIAGTLLFVVTVPNARRWLRRPEPYVSVLITLTIASPMIVWNAQHQFASLRFQAGRAASHGVHPLALAQNLAGQMGYLLPWIGIPLLWQLVRGIRTGPRDTPRWLLTCLSVVPIGVFTFVSLGGNPGLPHWPAPGYLLLFPLLGDVIARYEQRGRIEQARVSRAIITAVGVFVVLTATAASAIATGWPTRLVPSLFQRGDPTLEAVDWTALGPSLTARGVLVPGTVVITTRWIDAAKAGYALGPAYRIACFSDDPRGFRYAYPTSAAVGHPAVVLARVEDATNLQQRFARYFASLEPLDTVPITRAGQVVIRLASWRADRVLRTYPNDTAR